MELVIVNADDFGINETVTMAIEKAILAGSVSSTTVMANGSHLKEVKRFAVEHPEVSFGVHLCLSEFSSITKSEGLVRAGLTDEKGQFIHKAVFQLNNLIDTDVQIAVKDELNAQIELIKSLGFPISHADCHHHLQKIFSLRQILTEVLQSHGIRKMRLCGGFDTLRSKARVLSYLRNVALNRYYSSHFITTSAFYSYASFVNERKSVGDNNVIELMCHPGHPAERYQKEMQLVNNRIALGDGKLGLISYNEL